MRKTPSLTYILYCCIYLINSSIFSACSKDAPLTEPTFEIAEQDMQQGFLKSASTILVTINTTLLANEWTVTSPVDWCSATQSITSNNKAGISISVNANTSEKARETKVTIHSSVKDYTLTIRQQGTKPSIDDIQLANDSKIIPTQASASECQPGYDISKTFDGIIGEDENFYHSRFGKATIFPVTLEYFFSGHEDIDYFIYHTRNGNGNFGEVEIYTATEQEPRYKFYGSFNFRQQSASSKVEFTGGLKHVFKIKFLVKSGLGDFVSCDEMEFYKKEQENELNSQLLNIFTDITCSELKPEITDKQIAFLPSYFTDIALKLKNNSYDAWEKNFRIRSYDAYSIPEEWSEKLMTKNYSNLDNPTGISVKQGDEILILVGDTYGHSISAQCIWEKNTSNVIQTAANGDSYFLHTGINKLKMKGEGQLFIMYNTDIASLNTKPVKIHIPPGSGSVTGFFDLKEHKTNAKYAELLSKSTHKYFCVRGERIMFYFHRLKMLDVAPNEILSAINLWDDFIRWEQEMCGIESYRKAGKCNNHLFAISPEGGYMWASNYQIGFVYTYLKNILLRENVMAKEDNAWGPSHEIGHIHQLAINWPGCTESSNNLFSNYIVYRLGTYKSRGKGLCTLAKSVYGVDNRVWWNMGTPNAESEDTEIHMRMNWQLWIYYELCKGTEKTPTFWPKVFEIMRTSYRNIPESDPGARQMAFVKAVCEAAQEDLTEFFETWGFFKPTNAQVTQYGTFTYTITQQMIVDTKNEISKYPTKAKPIQYIEDRKIADFISSDYRYKEVGNIGYYTQFKENMKITKTPTYTQEGAQIKISNGEQAVAFEVRIQEKEEGKAPKMGEVVYFSNLFEFDLPTNINMNYCGIYAVQADGARILLSR